MHIYKQGWNCVLRFTSAQTKQNRLGVLALAHVLALCDPTTRATSPCCVSGPYCSGWWLHETLALAILPPKEIPSGSVQFKMVSMPHALVKAKMRSTPSQSQKSPPTCLTDIWIIIIIIYIYIYINRREILHLGLTRYPTVYYEGQVHSSVCLPIPYFPDTQNWQTIGNFIWWLTRYRPTIYYEGQDHSSVFFPIPYFQTNKTDRQSAAVFGR